MAYNLPLNTYLITAREKFQILKNGSDYQGAWPPLYYNNIPHSSIELI